MAVAPDSHSRVLMGPGLKGRQMFTKPFQDELDIDDEILGECENVCLRGLSG